jgi:hypothetical protein
MPNPIQESLDLAILSLNVANRLVAAAQNQLPPGPPNFPQLTTIVTVSATIQSMANQMASGGGNGPAPGTGVLTGGST